MLLQAEIVHPTTLRRFDQLVVSGDGGFAPVIAAAANAGVRTMVVSRADALSPKARLAAHRVITFDENTNITEVA
ncbi:hypothetical protein ACFUEJ_11385 [Gordonia sp. NPDC057258]|uniref:hypothetical protein n=1 Tax=unclassified Gordonia (in: high G+C Gram-positive bacteria) TaxID=2657482 RepID=UPI00362FCEB7